MSGILVIVFDPTGKTQPPKHPHVPTGLVSATISVPENPSADMLESISKDLAVLLLSRIEQDTK